MSRKLIFIGVCGALFLYQVIEISRKAESRDIRGIIDAFYLTADENENELEISSFDITTIGNRATFKIFDEKRKFFYGKFKLISLTSIIPYSSRLFVDNNDYYTGSSSVLKNEMIGLSKTWGVGTNIVSDCYMDFGIFGVIIILFLIGRYAGYVKSQTCKNINSAKWMFLYIITLSYLSEIARYGFDFPLRSIVWTTFLFFIVDKIFKSSYKIVHEKNI